MRRFAVGLCAVVVSVLTACALWVVVSSTADAIGGRVYIPECRSDFDPGPCVVHRFDGVVVEFTTGGIVFTPDPAINSPDYEQ